MQHIVLIDSKPHSAALLMHLIENKVDDIRVRCFAALEQASWYPKPAAVILNSLVPGDRGEVPPAVAEQLKQIAFEGPGLIVICSAFLLDPLFENGVRSLSGPSRLIGIERSSLDWTGRAIAVLNTFVRELRVTYSWYGLFPPKEQPRSSGAGLEPSTELVLLKKALKRLGPRDGMAGQLPVRREFMVRRERYLNEEEGYSLS